MIKTLKINNNLFVNVLKVDMPESNKESTSDVIEPSNQFLIFENLYRSLFEIGTSKLNV